MDVTDRTPRGFELDLAILRALAVEDTLTPIELADIVDADPATVDQVCYQLQREDSVTVRHAGHYRLTPGGRRRLQNHQRMHAPLEDPV